MRIRTYKNRSGSTVVQIGYDEGKNFKTKKTSLSFLSYSYNSLNSKRGTIT